MLAKIPRVYWAAVIIATVIGFYVYASLQRQGVRSRGQSVSLLSGYDFGIPFARFAGVESLRSVSPKESKELIAEIEKVIEQNGLPADVFYGLSSDVSREERQQQQSNNIAVTLHMLFREYYEPPLDDPTRPPNEDLEKLWNASPVGAWDINKETLDSVQNTLVPFEAKRQFIRDELKDPDKHFYYIFERPDSLVLKSSSHRQTVVNTGASKYLADYALLEEYVIAQALHDGNIHEAMEALAYTFGIAFLASQLADVGVRADVAHVRLRAFDVLQRVVMDPKFERQHMVSLRNILLQKYQTRTPEQTAWFGDRADGMMKLHHIMMDGIGALEPVELEWLKLRGAENDFRRRPRKYHEADMLFFLQSMQKVIDVSNQPLLKRQDVFNQIHREMRAKEHTYDKEGFALDPFVSGLRLKDVGDFMHLFAQDRSVLNRAIVAVLHSLGQGNTDNYRDPFTDKPYVVEQADGVLSISAALLPRPFQVPVFTEGEDY